MIVGFLLQLLYLFLSTIASFLPVYAIPAGVVSAISLIGGYINALSFLFPVGTLVQVLGIALFFHVSLLLIDLGFWVLHLIRGR